MKTVNIFRAQGIERIGECEPVTINIHGELPEVPYEQAPAQFASEGAALAEAIWASCPGGTVDALLAALFAKKASQFRVRFPVVSDGC